jgi:hypothetical protein
VGVFGVVDGGAIPLCEFGELDWDRLVDCPTMTYVVANVVGERADGEGEFVSGLGVVEEREDEVAGPDVVGKVGEELIAEGVVAEVLDGAAAVGVGVCFLKLGLGEGREATEQKRADGLLPGKVDEFLVRLDRVRDGRFRSKE